MSNLLVEIGTEELPETALHQIDTVLCTRIYGILSHEQNRLLPPHDSQEFDPKQIKVASTPRRITFFVGSLFERQADQTVDFVGPSYEKSYQAGQPTPALLGFLKSKNASLSDVIEKETTKGKFVSVKKIEKGKPAISVLPKMIDDLLTSLYFPKFMRWESTKYKFPRPIRWVVALLDKKIIPFELAGIKSGKLTYGHRFLSPKPILIPSADYKSYQKLLRRAHVLLTMEERKSVIQKALAHRFHQKKADEELVHTTACLVEEPFVLEGGFSKSYLDLPAELLASCMKKNQKIFAIYDAKSQMTNRFVAVMNGKRSGLSKIRADFENVLESRLRDARYFYDADQREGLEKRVSQLKQLTYLGKLGNMEEKTKRLEKLAASFADLVARHDIQSDLVRAAHFAKADLMTHLVYEFPDLQGIAGREYAIEAGEKEEIAKAIGSQYLPKNLAEDYREIPKYMTPLGGLFGLIDRFDLLAGAFGIGLAPTGSQDPYALRRAGGSLVKIIRAFRFHFSLSEALALAASGFGRTLEIEEKELVKKLGDFLKERVVFEIGVKPGSRDSEILQAVFRSSFEDLADVYDRFEILSRLYEREPESFLKSAKVVERTGNILKSTKGEIKEEVRSELFKEVLEKEIYRLLEECSSEIAESIRRRDYEQATLAYGKIFHGPIHDFFNKVMVNVEDEAVRRNRQALMKRVNRLYTENLADLSLLSKLD